MRREGRRPVAVMDRKSGMRRDAYIPVGESAPVENAIFNWLQNQ